MQTKTIDVQEAQASLDELLALIREGVEIILTEGGTPLARLTPVETGRRILGLHAHLGQAWMSDDFDDELPDEFWLGEE